LQIAVILATEEDCDTRPAQANSLGDLISGKKNHHKNTAERVAQGLGSEFKPQYHPK
jgi:hypothetical protein